MEVGYVPNKLKSKVLIKFRVILVIFLNWIYPLEIAAECPWQTVLIWKQIELTLLGWVWSTVSVANQCFWTLSRVNLHYGAQRTSGQ